jgi:hypothetical protein
MYFVKRPIINRTQIIDDLLRYILTNEDGTIAIDISSKLAKIKIPKILNMENEFIDIFLLLSFFININNSLK